MKKIPLLFLVVFGLSFLLAIPVFSSSTPDFNGQAIKFLSKNCNKLSNDLSFDTICFLLNKIQENENNIISLNNKIENVAHSKNKSFYVYDNKGNMLGPLIDYGVDNHNLIIFSMLIDRFVSIDPDSGNFTSRPGVIIYYKTSDCTGVPYINDRFINELFTDGNNYYVTSNNEALSAITYKSYKESLGSISCLNTGPNGDSLVDGMPLDNVAAIKLLDGVGGKLDRFLNLTKPGYLPLMIKFQ